MGSEGHCWKKQNDGYSLHPWVKVLQNVSVLKGVKNDKGQFYYVNKQLPEELAEKEREIKFQIKQLKSKEQNLTKHKKTKIEVRNNTMSQ